MRQYHIRLRLRVCHEPDEVLRAAGKPTRTEAEFDSYVWNPKLKTGEEPLKEHDHGMDAVRYLCRHLDGGSGGSHPEDYTSTRGTHPANRLPRGTF